MATQNEEFPPIDFSVSFPSQSVRLMEVSQEVLDIIEASRQHPTEKPILQFKSAPASISISSLARNSSTTKAKDSILHLCSEDKAWAIKQVSTSNSVYLIEPCPSIPTQTDGDAGINTNIPNRSITATSQIRNFLELHHVTIDEAEIETAIADLLPIHTNSSDLTNHTTKQDLSLAELVANVASPDTLVRSICARLCVSQRLDTGKCFVPTASAVLNTWKQVIQSCAIELISLDHAINPSRIIQVLPDPFDKAITQTLLGEGGTFEQHGLFETDHGVSAQYLRPVETCLFVATLVLRARSSSDQMELDTPPAKAGAIDAETFIQGWTNLLPSSWVKYCTLDTLRMLDHVQITTEAGGDWVDSAIGFDGLLFSNLRASTDLSAKDMKNDGSAATASAASSGKRKWHEKFGAQRNAKK